CGDAARAPLQRPCVLSPAHSPHLGWQERPPRSGRKRPRQARRSVSPNLLRRRRHRRAAKAAARSDGERPAHGPRPLAVVSRQAAQARGAQPPAPARRSRRSRERASAARRMSESLRIALAQLDLLVGDVQGNAARVIEFARAAHRAHQADLVAFPELALSGYPPEDLLFHRGFRRQIESGLEEVCRQVAGPCVMVGYPEYTRSTIYNSAAFIADGAVAAIHRKAELPNYKVFDEKRYFHAGAQPTVVDCKGFRVGLLVCEDIWEPEPAQLARSDRAELLVVINASPYERDKQRERESVVRARVADVALPIAYVNMVGGQDELVFDGNSFVMDAEGKVVMRAPAFQQGTYLIDFERRGRGTVVPLPGDMAPELSDEATVYSALVLGVRDYVNKHGFPGVVMGLSGGVDSALTLAIAVDALGADRVHAVMMPSRFTASMSLQDAAEEARLLGVKYSELSI